MRSVLVTGAAGYIGSALVGVLLNNGDRVVAYDRFHFGRDALNAYNDHQGLTLVQKDIRDAELADFAGITAVCDLAALSNDPSGEIDPVLTVAVNHKGRSRICRLAKEAGVRRYVMSSSCAIYGPGGAAHLDETSPTAPLTTYAQSNYNAERDNLPLADENFAVTILRIATVFGLSARMRFDLVINAMTLHGAERGVITVMGGGDQWRPLAHVSDVARMFHRVIEADPEKVSGEIFNVGRTNLQIGSLAEIVRQSLPVPVTIEVAPDNPDKRDYNVSFEKARNVLGFEAETTIEAGVKEIYEALKSGRIEHTTKTRTVDWYQSILEVKG